MRNKLTRRRVITVEYGTDIMDLLNDGEVAIYLGYDPDRGEIYEVRYND